ncbi:MAG: aminotransferase class V-fold PLP-dependent enzyme [Phycisphaerae bacterium]|nr:aminotransferase class V-fold PLP-dependent enzyme [Phycisphaerae bacterium]
MPDRRAFLGSLALPAAALALPRVELAPFSGVLAEIEGYDAPPDQAATDEDFWAVVARAFTVDRSVINLNNGGVSPSPALVQDAVKRHLDFSNSCPPPVSLWRILEPQKEGVRDRLARHWGVSPDEVAITRNSSESLQICQLGLDLKRGDEILCCTQDYPRMITTFKQRERREGVVLRQIQLPIPSEDPDDIVRRYAHAITPATRLMLMSHVINITGQVLPVRPVVAMARQRGVPVIVDGAHALAQIAFKLADLDCDYYGVSLHKWLFAPHGTGLLYVRKDKIPGLWPMQAADEKAAGDIRKFEEIGTHPAAPFLAIGEALTFHQAIGDARKEARLRHMRDTWAMRLLAHRSGRVRLHTSLDPRFSCAIGTVQIDGIESDKLGDWLWSTRRILTTPIKHPEFEGLRVTASVYTTLEELDRFCSAVEHAIEKGLG